MERGIASNCCLQCGMVNAKAKYSEGRFKLKTLLVIICMGLFIHINIRKYPQVQTREQKLMPL